MDNYASLTFRMSLPSSPKRDLINGYLIVKRPDKEPVTFSVTSGLPGFQYWKSWELKGRGCIPPSSLGISYTLASQRLWLPSVKGVEGSFYPIAPFQVAIGALRRGDFGLHWDAGQIGSAGCLVVRVQDHWDIIRNLLKACSDNGCKALPLSVEYTQM